MTPLYMAALIMLAADWYVAAIVCFMLNYAALRGWNT